MKAGDPAQDFYRYIVPSAHFTLDPRTACAFAQPFEDDGLGLAAFALKSIAQRDTFATGVGAAFEMASAPQNGVHARRHLVCDDAVA